MHVQDFAQVVESQVPIRYHLGVPEEIFNNLALPAVLQNQRDSPTHCTYEARGRVIESPLFLINYRS